MAVVLSLHYVDSIGILVSWRDGPSILEYHLTNRNLLDV